MFRRRAATVARPVAVRPRMRTPPSIQAKCSDQPVRGHVARADCRLRAVPPRIVSARHGGGGARGGTAQRLPNRRVACSRGWPLPFFESRAKRACVPTTCSTESVDNRAQQLGGAYGRRSAGVDLRGSCAWLLTLSHYRGTLAPCAYRGLPALASLSWAEASDRAPAEAPDRRGARGRSAQVGAGAPWRPAPHRARPPQGERAIRPHHSGSCGRVAQCVASTRVCDRAH